jgi:hypothetical protein
MAVTPDGLYGWVQVSTANCPLLPVNSLYTGSSQQAVGEANGKSIMTLLEF